MPCMQETLIAALRAIGLTDGESRVYAALLSVKTSSVGPLIEKAGVSSSKIYVILDKLIAKGLVTLAIEDKHKIFTALRPEQVKEYLERGKVEIEENLKRFEEILPALTGIYLSAPTQPTIELSKGRKGFESIYRAALEGANPPDRYLALAGERIGFGIQSHWPEFHQQLARKGISQMTIYEHAVWHQKSKSVHQRKSRKQYYPLVLDRKYDGLPTITILGDTVILSDLDDGDVFTLVIRHKNLTAAFKKLLGIIAQSATVPQGYSSMPKKELSS